MTTRDTVSTIMKEIKPTTNLETVLDIVEGGYIDSFELMSLISSLSDTFQIEIAIDDITPENFNSLDAISTMVDNLVNKQH